MQIPMASIVEVKLELGHRAKVRDVPSHDQHTHDWVIFVKGIDRVQLEHFVEKVVFWLHESYEQPKRVIKHPPYKVEQSGFAGFNMLIDVHFRNKEDPKMVRFQYDLFLHTEAMPPVNHTRLEKLTFTNPTEDFRKKLLAAGATLINPMNSSRPREKSLPSLSPSGSSSKKEKLKSSKDGIKYRERSSSSGGKHQERKRSTSHSGKKDGRIAGKDMKRHDDSFKQPKSMGSRTHKDSEGDKSEVVERGRPEKRRSFAGNEEGSKTKKKRHSEDPNQSKDRSKSLNTSTSTSGSIQQKKEKMKTKKIRDKPDVMAGLFAPETSININQIKQSKEKSKQDLNEVKVKKEKPSSSMTPSYESAPATAENVNVGKPSPGDLTLKIKKDKIVASKAKKERESPSKHQKFKSKEKRASEHTEKRPSKESASGSSKMADQKTKLKKSRLAVSSDSSSSSDSDMDISECEPEDVRKPHQEVPRLEKSQVIHDGSKMKSKSQSHTMQNISQKKHNNAGKDARRDKHSSKSETNSNRSLSVTPKREGKSKSESTGMTPKKGVESEKRKNSSKEERKRKVDAKDDSHQMEVKREKRSSKDRPKDKSKKAGHGSSQKKDQTDNTTVTDMILSPISPSRSNIELSGKGNNSREDYPSPGASFLGESAKTASHSKTNKPTNKPGSTMKPNTSTLSKKAVSHSESPPRTNKSHKHGKGSKVQKKIIKSRSQIETSSDDDSDAGEEVLNLHNPVTKTKRASVSSQSSITDDESVVSSHGHDVPPNVQNHPVEQDIHHSSSSSSSDEDGEMSDFPHVDTSNMAVISPIADRTNHNLDSEYTVNAAYRDMEMSDSSGDSPLHQHPVEEEVKNPYQINREEPSLPPSASRLHDFTMQQDLNTSSSEDEAQSSPMEKPFQYHEEEAEPSPQENPHNNEEIIEANQQEPDDLPYVTVKVDTERRTYPHLNSALYQELQELQRKLSYVTDVERLRKIASIVAKSQKLKTNSGYFDFDLCSLDHKTIHKIQKQLKAL